MIKWILNKAATIVIIFSVIILPGCEEHFEFSPYAAKVSSAHKNTHVANINNLVAADTIHNKDIKFAIIADSHYKYHELNEAIININSREDIDFVIVNGDMADHGYLKEYEMFHRQMDKLVYPYLTVIGNHDYRSNGGKIYTQMFGEPNKSFSFANNLFILFDDVFWESNKTPDFDWLEQELVNSTHYNHVFVICHIPPYTDQFTEELEEKYRQFMLNYNVKLSIHGHIHRYEYGDYYGDGMKYLAVGSIIDKEYGLITVTGNEIMVEPIKY